MIIGIDPGKDKCGLAVVDQKLNIRFKEVIKTNSLIDKLKVLKEDYDIEEIVLGDGTKSNNIASKLEGLFKNIHIIDESHSTLEAREYYWQDNPRRGWRRLLPITMQMPPEPVDDYVAVILVLRYLNSFNKEN
ncbi:resolvase [Orenia metallireducens]|jgi:RNase H-fold protein (predicted Holliday junction resolvase)|uniref:Resolvase n=1 Tax=Orenia metallireducens TaxID=1413210 RepID=A0A1C0A637_9FIRM|nr:Holliday junction resolvase RuvX [Orenia metallireducens]OCL25598.1 resolvase [Orenia metallireducens]